PGGMIARAPESARVDAKYVSGSRSESAIRLPGRFTARYPSRAIGKRFRPTVQATAHATSARTTSSAVRRRDGAPEAAVVISGVAIARVQVCLMTRQTIARGLILVGCLAAGVYLLNRALWPAQNAAPTVAGIERELALNVSTKLLVQGVFDP